MFLLFCPGDFVCSSPGLSSREQLCIPENEFFSDISSVRGCGRRVSVSWSSDLTLAGQNEAQQQQQQSDGSRGDACRWETGSRRSRHMSEVSLTEEQVVNLNCCARRSNVLSYRRCEPTLDVCVTMLKKHSVPQSNFIHKATFIQITIQFIKRLNQQTYQVRE